MCTFQGLILKIAKNLIFDHYSALKIGHRDNFWANLTKFGDFGHSIYTQIIFPRPTAPYHHGLRFCYIPQGILASPSCHRIVCNSRDTCEHICNRRKFTFGAVCCLDPSCPLLPHSYIFRHSWILDTLKWSDSMIILI